MGFADNENETLASEWIKIVWAGFYAIMSAGVIVFCIAKFRHNLRNKANHEVSLRHRKFINSFTWMGLGTCILIIGTIVVLMDIGEVVTVSNRVTSQWGWWIACALYITLTMRVLANYHHLTVEGTRMSEFLGLLAGACLVFTSLSNSTDARILWTSIGCVLTLIAHLFILYRSRRIYFLIPLSPQMQMGLLNAPNGHNVTIDVFLLIHSCLWFFAVWISLCLSFEVFGVIPYTWINEAAYGAFFVIHWIGTVVIVDFQFMDLGYLLPKSHAHQ